MDGHVAESRLTALRRGGVIFAPARADDEDDLRALLADLAMAGRYRLAFERVAAPRAPIGPCLSHATMIARDEASGVAVGCYERVTRRAFVNGAPTALPYLAALRIAPSHRRRLALLRAGFESLRAFARPDEAPFALTSIGADNTAARRLLAAGLPGLPRYEPAGAVSTLALRCLATPIAPDIAPAQPQDLPALAAFLNARNATRQFAPAWSEDDLAALAQDGLPCAGILLARRGGVIVGSIAAWDQTARRRTVVRAYPPALRALRPLLNLAAPWTGLPPLAPEGQPLRQATLALLAVAGDDVALVLRLVAAALTLAHANGLDVAALGLPVGHAWHDAVRRERRALEYRTVLYRVIAPDAAARVTPLDGRPPQPEIALL